MEPECECSHVRDEHVFSASETLTEEQICIRILQAERVTLLDELDRLQAEVAALREERHKLDNVLWSAAFLLGRLDTLEEVTVERDDARAALAAVTEERNQANAMLHDATNDQQEAHHCQSCEEARRALADKTP